MAVLSLAALISFVVSVNSIRTFQHGRSNKGLLPPPVVSRNIRLPPDQWIDQKLDNFNDAEPRIWRQRYFVNDTFYKPGGPVFLMIGGEGRASPVWMVTGTWITLAQEFNALCFQVEHRFYGDSHPTWDMSTDHLQYLSSEQALADLAHFRNAMTEKWNLKDNKWIAFGGSYPGSLAAWFRLKFPHLVDGSVATSAPIKAELDFEEYLGVVYDSLATTGSQCNPAISNATATIEDMIKTTDGRKQLMDMFRLCEDLDISNSNDIANFYSVLTGNFEGVVQYNKDNRHFEGGGDNITIDTLCGIMTNEQIGSPLQRYAAVNLMMLSKQGDKCVDFNYDNMINELRQTDWNSSASEGGRQWTYQTCTEFGYYQSSDLAKQPFGHHFPVGFSTQQCADIFGEKFTEQMITDGIERTNTNYGGLGIKVTKVVFPNGSIDPWHALGVTSDLSPEATAIYIKGTAHCANMYPASPDDPPQLIQARQQIRKLVALWIQA